MLSRKQQSHKEKIKEFSPLREKMHEVIFEADTPLGRNFDIALLFFIVASIVVVMLESVPSYQDKYQTTFVILEWIFTIFFTIEYIARLYCTYRPMKYATSFYGVIDLLSILPTYLSLLIGGTQYFMVIRALRLLRVFRIFKLGSFLSQAHVISNALKASRDKIIVFLFAILILVCLFGSFMYLIEGGEDSAFDSIPRSVYWAIVTLTTVGYGDISPQTTFGQFVASVIMILGYAVIAVPTGIVSNELIKSDENLKDEDISTQSCRYCLAEGHPVNAKYCYECGEQLNPKSEDS